MKFRIDESTEEGVLKLVLIAESDEEMSALERWQESFDPREWTPLEIVREGVKYLLLLSVVVLSGCTSFSSVETCVPQKDGYSHCAGVAEWQREPACSGSCKP